MLEVDAWIDSNLYESRFAAGEIWEEIIIFSRRFRARGIKRFFVEIPVGVVGRVGPGAGIDARQGRFFTFGAVQRKRAGAA